MAELNVNTDELVEWTNRLEKMHKSDFPVAVRQTLDGAAFDMKKDTLQKQAHKAFTVRQKNFFKATSVVNKAEGFDLKKMEATVGFSREKQKRESYAVSDLEEQERGGKLEDRPFIPLKPARTSGSTAKKVKKRARISDITQIVDPLNEAHGNTEAESKIVGYKGKGSTDAERFILAAIFAGKGGHVLSTVTDGAGNRFVLKINSINTKGNNTKISTTPLYLYREGRDISVKSKKFREKAAKESTDKLDDLFIKNARGRIQKALAKR